MDEYTSEIFMGGKSTIVLHNTCEDSLLAAPIILDLVLLAELSTRIQLKAEGEVCFIPWSLWNGTPLCFFFFFVLSVKSCDSKGGCSIFLQGKFHSFHPVATILSYLSKAPLVSLYLVFSYLCFKLGGDLGSSYSILPLILDLDLITTTHFGY